MEDAMVLNKCSMERGLAHGQIYKTEVVDLTQQQQGKRQAIEVWEKLLQIRFENKFALIRSHILMMNLDMAK